MIRHYLKVAFRNMWKYRSQTFISIAGLAVGFACFAMATLWIRYEMTYDRFHKNADRLYCLYRHNVFTGETARAGHYLLPGYIRTAFPEIAGASSVIPWHTNIEYEGVEHSVDWIRIDSSFLTLFDIKIVEGSMDFLIPESKNIAVTREKAIRLFGNDSPVGKRIKVNGEEYTVCTAVAGLPKQSNYQFDFIEAMRQTKWNYGQGEHTIVEIAPNVNVDTLKRKFYENKSYVAVTTIFPLTEIRYKGVDIKREVKFQHIILFAVAGSLLILCTLFNYLTLFVSRFRIRQKELALRTVYGASTRSLFAMLSVEFLVSLIAALLLCAVLIQAVLPYFRTVSETRLELPAIYLESAIYTGAIIVVALTAFLLTLAVFKRRTLDASIRGNKKMFRKMSIVVQLTVSIVFAFCTVIILKQMYHLHNTDLGFAFKNRGSVYIPADYEQVKVLNDKIRQIPEIETSLSGYYPMLPIYAQYSYSVGSVEGVKKDNLNIQLIFMSEQFAEYYEFKLIAGEMLNENDDPKRDVLINESAVKYFGWTVDEAVGKTFDAADDHRVKGVIRNVYSFSPTIAAKQFCYLHPRRWEDGKGDDTNPFILFKYAEGSRNVCMEKIRKTVAEELPNVSPDFSYDEDEYNKFLKSENT
ncbi:MAG: ABC transporter permease, partial [Prevotellaceae bacterium]|nr:ABC transporter permease [Prevotellaceae bacterium]